LLGGVAKNRVVDCKPLLPGIDVRLKEEAMTSKIATITSFAAVLGITAASAVASPPSKTDIPPPYAADIHVSSGAPSTKDTSQLVLGYLEYIDALRDRSDVSFERMQSALGSPLRPGDFGGSDISSTYAGGDRITLRFWGEVSAEVHSASLEFLGKESPGEFSPPCRLPYDSLRDRLLQAGYDEAREWSELEDAGAWLFFKGDVWIEVSTRWPNAKQADRTCVREIDAHEKLQSWMGST
jgi:hypothetical protein